MEVEAPTPDGPSNPGSKSRFEAPTKSEQTKAPDEGIQFPASSASLRNEAPSYFQPAAQLDESVANSTCVNSVEQIWRRGRATI